MKGKAGRVGGPPADLMVCFPTRAHLRLMAPKPICSPSRAAADHHQPPARASPLFKARPNRNRGKEVLPSSEISEPTSPKVTCAGQIKVRRPKHRSRVPKMGKRRRPLWLETLGFKKDVMHLIAAIRGLRFKVSCFGSFHGSVDCTEEEQKEDEEEVKEEGSNVFSKWFTMLEEENLRKEEEEKKKDAAFVADDGGAGEDDDDSSVAPPNALLLMRCRSAPANGLSRREEEKRGGDQGSGNKRDDTKKKKVKEGKEEEIERLVLMSYAPDFFKMSSDIVKETWVVGSTDPLLRSRSWKR